MDYSAGLMIFVYCLWNCYVVVVLFLYAPSHKNWPVQNGGNMDIFTSVKVLETWYVYWLGDVCSKSSFLKLIGRFEGTKKYNPDISRLKHSNF